MSRVKMPKGRQREFLNRVQRQTDREYSIFLQKIVKKLFSISSSISYTKTDKGDNVVVSTKNLVEFLEKIGLKRGNKVREGIDIPKWISRNRNYQISCLRGLVDTDGSFYLYRHKVYNKTYCNFAMCFTNHSEPLLKSTYKMLKMLHFNPIISQDNRVYLHKKREIDRYFSDIGTHNPKHLNKYNNYLACRNINN